MLLKITNKCFMNCIHCSEESTPEGKHMPMDIFNDSLVIIKRFNCKVLLITGGEPTTHPHIIEIINTLKPIIGRGLLLASNGMFINNENILTEILKTNIQIQITNDSKYYPHKIKEFNHSNIYYENHIRQIAPFGRAIKNKIPTNRQLPTCFNLRSITNSIDTHKFADIINYMEMKINKFCKPSIDIDGSIKIGEHNSCFVIGNIYDSDKTLMNNIKQCKCNKCGLFNNLAENYKKAVGES